MIHKQNAKTKSVQLKGKFQLIIIKKALLSLISILFWYIIFFRLFTNCESYITLVIKGEGNQRFLYSGFSYTPSDVIIDGISKKEKCSKTYELDKNETKIKLVFDNQINSCSEMFRDLENITEIDLSEFDASKVHSMQYMFYNCSNLKNINFGEINTSYSHNMEYMFSYCENLENLNLSSFEILLM